MTQKEIPILFEDEHLVVVAKEAGELVVPSPWTLKPQTLLGRIQVARPGRTWAVHRLDRETSGIVIFARSKRALKSLHDQFQERKIKKVYHVIVEGVVQRNQGVLTQRLEKAGHWTKGQVAKAGSGKHARTEFAVMERYKGHTLLEAKPTTGRFHQIRIHFKQMGYPLACDAVYNKGAKFMLERLSLHASRMTFRHPVTRQVLELGCPWPDDFSGAIEKLRKASR
mgnify:CR=1 FL=1